MNRFLIIFLFSLICLSSVNAQKISRIAESEAKAATTKISFRANPNTSNYDITYHKLEFDVNPAVAFISGMVTTTFTALTDMTTVTFDLDDNLTVSQVTQNGNAVSFSQNSNDELVITLQNTLTQGNPTSVIISYSGNPTSNGFGSFEINTHNGTPILWTLSEPYGALGWWPCKQDLNDKVDVIDVFVTAPEQCTAVSNGLEINQTISSPNKTTHFKHQYPIPAYLIAIAVTNYQTYSHIVPNNGNPFPIVNYVYPESITSAQNNTQITVDIMNNFINLFGNYPFENEKYGHAQFGWGGGMEHTTVSFMGSFNRNLIAHELAHQWFGDKITCGSWKDIWLNEGFATYLSGLTIENLDGDDAFKNWRNSNNNSITSLSNGAVYLTDADTTSVGRIFNSRLSYKKGAMVLHMLRRKLGETNFFNGIKNYITDPNLAYKYAKTPDLIAHLEASSGLDLEEFFNDWIYNQGYPIYSLTWSQTPSNTLNIKLDQTQSHTSVSFFETPVPVRLTGTGGETLDIVLDNTSNAQNFTENVSFVINSLEIDPDHHLISRNNSTVLNTEDNLITENQISVFPNPVTSLLKIKTSNDITIKNTVIYNTIGEKVLEFSTNNINLSKLTNGIYFLKTVTSQGFFYKSIIKN